MVRGLLQHNTMSNLYATHPPFQMDGNFGITAGICEMLLQSHAGEVAVVPALPEAWKDGSFTGLRARGGFTVDATWSAGRPVKVVVHSTQGAPCRLRVPAGAKLTGPGGQAVAGAAEKDGILTFPTKARQAYEIRW
jgi:alpha-L-fucosidase 2